MERGEGRERVREAEREDQGREEKNRECVLGRVFR